MSHLLCSRRLITVHMTVACLRNKHLEFNTVPLSLSEFLAEESQEKFWDFVEANQNIEGEHDGIFKRLSHNAALLSLSAFVLPAAEFMMRTRAVQQHSQCQCFLAKH